MPSSFPSSGLAFRSVLTSFLLVLIVAFVVRPDASAAVPASSVSVTFLRGEQLMQVRRRGSTPEDAVRALLAGPNRVEAAHAYRTYVPPRTALRRLAIRDGLATLDLSAGFLSRSDERVLAGVSQLVQTLSAFPQVKRVRLLFGGRSVSRTVRRVSLARPITMRYLRTPDVPVPKPPPFRLPAPDAATLQAQKRLIRIGFLVAGDADGRFGPKTSQALLAFQKFERLTRSGVLDASTRASLPAATRPRPVTLGAGGRRAEILLDRQVALLIQNNRVVRTIAVSTGKPSTPTPPGSYRVYAKIPRWWSTPFREWLPWALPFVGGIAFHQYAIVPAYAASHGCVRQSFAVARWTYDFARVGMPVRVLARS